MRGQGVGDESKLGPVVLICSPECLEKGTLLAVAHKIIDTPSLKILTIVSDQMLQGLDQTPWLGCFLLAIAVTDCYVKNLVKFVKF